MSEKFAAANSALRGGTKSVQPLSVWPGPARARGAPRRKVCSCKLSIPRRDEGRFSRCPARVNISDAKASRPALSALRPVVVARRLLHRMVLRLLHRLEQRDALPRGLGEILPAARAP